MFNWTITVGNVIEVAVILGSGLWVLITMRFNLRILRHDFRSLEQRQQVMHETAANEHAKLEAGIDLLRSEAGEMGLALRQKITELELYVRDTFVRRETFGPLMSKLEGEVSTVGDKIEARLLRMETKLDTKT